MPAKSSAATKSVARKAARRKPTMTVQHKQALAVGREESRAVRRYLEALEAHKPKRGRKRTIDSIKGRLKQVENRLPDADPLTRVHLAQEKLNLEAELAAKEDKVDMGSLESGFISAAKAYGQRKGITYAAWRSAGVDPSVLRKAGVPRTRG